MAEYAKTRAIHKQIEGLYPAVEQAQAYFRSHRRIGHSIPVPYGGPKYLDHDRFFSGLAIRAATTKRAIFTLCEAGDGDNGMALVDEEIRGMGRNWRRSTRN